MENEDSTDIYSWGSDRYGQLGIGNKIGSKCYNIPRLCNFNLQILMISCGEEHACILSSAGKLYSMGSNNEGRLGIGDETVKQISTPCLVESLSGINLKFVSCGWGHSAAISEKGELYTWGVGEYGALGLGSQESKWTPQKVLFSEQQEVQCIEVSCGTRHTVVSDEIGRFFTFGSGDAGQLGTASRNKELKPVLMKSIPDKILKGEAGIFHTLVLTISGKVYAMGGNNFGQLGIGNKRSSTIPVKVIELDLYLIKKISAGQFSAAINDKGELFVWGTSSFGEYLKPVKQSSLLFKDIQIGGGFAIALDHEGNAYSWGSNSAGELGLGDFENRTTPTLIQSLKGIPLIQVSCGGSYTIALKANIKKLSNFTSPIGLSKKIENLSSKVSHEENKSIKPIHSHHISQVKSSMTNEAVYESIKHTENKTEDINLLKMKLINKESENKELANEFEENKRKLNKLNGEIQMMNSKFATLADHLQLIDNKTKELEEENINLKNENLLLKEKRLKSPNAYPNIKEILNDYEKKLEKEIETRHLLIAEKTEEVNKLHEILSELENKLDHKQEELANLDDITKQEIANLNIKLEKVNMELDVCLKENHSLIAKNQEFEQLLKNSILTNEKLNEEMSKLGIETTEIISNERLQKQQLENQISDLKNENLNILNDLERTKISLELERKEIEENYKVVISKLKNDINELNQINDTMNQNLNIKENEIDVLKKEVDSWKEIVDRIGHENNDLKKVIENLEEKNKKLVETLNLNLFNRAADFKEKTVNALKNSHSPMIVSKILSNERQKTIVMPSPQRLDTILDQEKKTTQLGILTASNMIELGHPESKIISNIFDQSTGQNYNQDSKLSNRINSSIQKSNNGEEQKGSLISEQPVYSNIHKITTSEINPGYPIEVMLPPIKSSENYEGTSTDRLIHKLELDTSPIRHKVAIDHLSPSITVNPENIIKSGRTPDIKFDLKNLPRRTPELNKASSAITAKLIRENLESIRNELTKLQEDKNEVSSRLTNYEMIQKQQELNP